MQTTTKPSWTVPEALSVAYKAFAARFGADLLHQAFEALTLHPKQTMAMHRALRADMVTYLDYALDVRGAGLVVWMANARADLDQAPMLLDCAVRWWCARDAMLRLPLNTRVPCIYMEGLTAHSDLQLLEQMLRRASAPDTEPSSERTARGIRQ